MRKVRVPTILDSNSKGKKSPRMTTKGNHPGEELCDGKPSTRAMRVSRREVSKNIFKKERKLELTDYCDPVENCTEKTLSENKICTDIVM